VHHPPEEGKHAHVTFGFAGIYGALAGMSSAGISVHEANLESNRDTFRGFPWLVRLRYIMENASNLEESKTLWDATKNTVGFNHMVASASDNAALVMETDAKHTAYFSANS
jgi:predicted choloylglycine hydrolase